MRSGLIGRQLWPPFSVTKTTFDPKIEAMLVERVERQRLGTHRAILLRRQRDRRDFLGLARALVELLDLSSEEDAGMKRIGNDVAVLLCAHRVPIAFGRLAPVAAARARMPSRSLADRRKPSTESADRR